MVDLRRELGELWRQVNRQVHERMREAFRGSEMHFGMMMMLRGVHKTPGLTVSELARRAGIAKSHVSKSIDTLSQQGYLEKRPDPSDQRLLRLYLTPRAADLMADMEARAFSVWSAVMDEVPEAELEGMARSFRILLEAFQKAQPTEPPSSL